MLCIKTVFDSKSNLTYWQKKKKKKKTEEEERDETKTQELRTEPVSHKLDHRYAPFST